jgi:hypothetical protein
VRHFSRPAGGKIVFVDCHVKKKAPGLEIATLIPGNRGVGALRNSL